MGRVVCVYVGVRGESSEVNGSTLYRLISGCLPIYYDGKLMVVARNTPTEHLSFLVVEGLKYCYRWIVQYFVISTGYTVVDSRCAEACVVMLFRHDGDGVPGIKSQATQISTRMPFTPKTRPDLEYNTKD